MIVRSQRSISFSTPRSWRTSGANAAAEGVFRAISTVAAGLIHFPEMGRGGRLPGMPYLIVYQINPDMLTVPAAFHGARDLAQALSRRQSVVETCLRIPR